MKTINGKGRTALITGASGGLGKEFALLFAADSFDLVLVARSLEKLNSLKAELEEQFKIRVFVLSQDLSKESAPKAVLDFVKSNGIKTDVLVNNAGFGDCSDFMNSDLDRQMNMIDLNVKALVKLTHLFLPELMQQQESFILNIASIAAFIPGPYMAVYYASKAFVLSFSEALCQELEQKNVYVSALCPGPTGTEFFNVANGTNLKFFRFIKLDNPHKVAQLGYKKLFSKKAVILPSGARQMAQLPRFLTRKAVRSIMGSIQKPQS